MVWPGRDRWPGAAARRRVVESHVPASASTEAPTASVSVGIEVPAGQLVDAPTHWPAVEVRLRTAPAPAPAAEYVTDGWRA